MVTAARTEIAISIFEAMAKHGYDFAYPTQTTFTAAPDGKMIMPFADSVHLMAPTETKSVTAP